MAGLAYVSPLIELMQNEFVQSKVEEAAKLFYNSNTVTINLVPALIAGALLLLLLVPLLALLFQPTGAIESGYGAPDDSYGAPAPAYGAPEYRSDEGYEEFRSLFTNLLGSQDVGAAAGNTFDISKRIQQVGPAMAALGNAAKAMLE